MKKLSIVLLLVAVILVGCAGPVPTADTAIMSYEPYYIAAIRPSSFTYPDPIGVTADVKVKLNPNDRSYMQFIFDENKIEFWLDASGGWQKIDFVLTGYSLKNNNINATASRVYKNQVVRYTIWSDAQKIYMKTDVSYKVQGVNTDGQFEISTVSRNATVLVFHRIKPGYIT